MLPKVLLVEDDEILREVYAVKFALAGFEVELAENGAVALAKLARFKPQVVLLDMMMPVMTGREFLEQLGEQVRDLDIIIFSNISQLSQVQAVMKLGARDFWVKSDYTPDQVAREIARRWQKRKRS